MAEETKEKKEENKKEEEGIKTKLTGMTPGERKIVVTKYVKKFNTAEAFRKPYQAKWLRMYKLYRAYRDDPKYEYQTNLIPPIAFEVVETVKPRMGAAKINVRIIPRGKADAKSKSLDAWESLVKYYFWIMKFTDRKIKWIDSALKFGNGLAQISWGNGEGEDSEGDPVFNIQDLWLFYWDPEATDLQEDSGYEMVRIFKKIDKIKDEEKEREKNGIGKIYQNLEEIRDKKIDDPRKERYEINTKKMGQIAKGGADADEGDTSEEKITEEKTELLQIWDHEKNMLITIANRDELIRYEKSGYIDVNKGRLFINLVDHESLWEMMGIGHIEPIETTINEIADSRNQAMDDIVFSLDPIRKVRKNSNLEADDLKYEPGAVWKLTNVDDVVTERPPEVSREWMDKDAILRKEIRTTLAISEYSSGLPKSTTEAKSKVDLLLMQSNIRFSLLVRQLEISVTQVVTNLIELTKEFLTKAKSYRLVGEDIDFNDFTDKDRDVEVDAIVEIEPQEEKLPEQRKAETIDLYKIFVAEDKPNPENIEEVEQWLIKKRTIQKWILEDYGREQYIDVILGAEKEVEEEAAKAEKAPPPGAQPAPGPAPAPPGMLKELMRKIPLIKRLT